jgi:hypothetical protein
MNKPIDGGPNIVPIHRTEQLPEVTRNERIFIRAVEVMERRWRDHRLDMGWEESKLAMLDAVLPELQAVLDDLNALARPASKREIAEHLAVLINCYPNGRPADFKTFGHVLGIDVAAAQPTIGDVEGACRRYRRNSEFFPTIAGVLKALEAAKQQRQKVSIPFSLGMRVATTPSRANKTTTATVTLPIMPCPQLSWPSHAKWPDNRGGGGRISGCMHLHHIF